MGSILGIGGSIHDFASCLITEDREVLAIEDERLTRVRYAIGAEQPCERSQRDCLERAGLKLSDVAAVIGNDMLARLVDQTRHPNTQLINHHLTHAYSTFFTSPFDEAAILVVDGSGSLIQPISPSRFRETLTYYRAEHNQVTMLGRVSGASTRASLAAELPGLRANSLGDFYRVITEVIGFGYLHAGKTMGLAPYGQVYGDERFVDEIMRSIKLLPAGQFEIAIAGTAGLLEHLSAVRQECLATEEQFRVDAALAHSGQVVLERLLFHSLEFLWSQTQTPNLCIAGGVGLNSMVNGKIAGATNFKNVHIFFAPGDSGTAIGAAIWGFLHARGEETGTAPVRFPIGPYLGRRYDQARIRGVLERFGCTYSAPANLAETVARMVTQAAVVAWYQGGSEFGPRALGNRSILGDPRRADVRDRINGSVKHREWFRPLAPAVIDSEAQTYFEIGAPAPWMQFVWPVREDYRPLLAGVTHIDGTARVPTVRAQDNPAFYEVLAAFRDLTGLPMLINTSFNTHGGPIVETPEEAVETFANSALDALAIGEFLAIKPS